MNAEIERLRKKAENYPSPSVYGRLADLLHREGDHDGAEQICRRCIKEFPRKGDAYVILARIMLSRQQRAKALELLQQGVDTDPRCPEGLLLLADLSQEDGDQAMATTCLERLLVLKPNDEALAKRLADLRQNRPANGAGDDVIDLRHDSETVDLTRFSSGLTSVLGAIGEPPAAAGRPPTSRISSNALLRGLISEKGVRGAVIIDTQGAPVVSDGLDDSQQEALLAGLGHEVQLAATAALGRAGGDSINTWAIAGEQGQIMAFRRQNGHLTLLALADPHVKSALLELKARQALIDLGEA